MKYFLTFILFGVFELTLQNSINSNPINKNKNFNQVYMNNSSFMHLEKQKILLLTSNKKTACEGKLECKSFYNRAKKVNNKINQKNSKRYPLSFGFALFDKRSCDKEVSEFEFANALSGYKNSQFDDSQISKLFSYFTKFNILQKEQIAVIIGELIIESGNFYFDEEHISKEYANRRYLHLYGNQDKEDGYKYRGRGFIQLSFKENYRDATNWLNKYFSIKEDLINFPELVQKYNLEITVAYVLERKIDQILNQNILFEDKVRNSLINLNDVQRALKTIVESNVHPLHSFSYQNSAKYQKMIEEFQKNNDFSIFNEEDKTYLTRLEATRRIKGWNCAALDQRIENANRIYDKLCN